MKLTVRKVGMNPKVTEEINKKAQNSFQRVLNKHKDILKGKISKDLVVDLYIAGATDILEIINNKNENL